MKIVLDKFPLYTIFILFLMICANFIGDLIPCKVQMVLNQNIFIKHFIAFLTLTFFVVFTDDNLDYSFNKIIMTSVKMYSIFIVFINTNKHFFIISLFLLGLTYLINLKLAVMKKKIEQNAYHDDINLEKQYVLFNNVNNILFYLLNFSIVIGFIIYIGEKKIEYKDQFNYITFLFGNSKCKNFSPKTSLIQSFKRAFY